MCSEAQLSPRLLKLISVSTLWPPKVQDQKGSWLPRPLRRVVMGAEIKASGLDRNADAAEGTGGQQKRGWVRVCEREGQRTDLSAERPIQLIPCTRAQNYLQLNDPIHRCDAPPPSPLPLTSNTKPQLTSMECLSIVLHHVVTQTDVNA